MIRNLTITAVIPVRSGSRRVPNKNIRKFANSSLLVNKINQLKTISLIDNIIVSSDSNQMLDEAVANGVGIHRRPIEYCDEKSRTFNEVVEYVASGVGGDILMWTPCTTPLLHPKSYVEALEKFEEHVLGLCKYDSVVSAKLLKEYVFDENGPANFNPDKHCLSQDLPEWKVVINGYYIALRKDMIHWRYFYGKKPLLIPVDKYSAIDIDDIDDFTIAEVIYNYKFK